MKRKLVVCFFAMVVLLGLSIVSMADPITQPVYFDQITLISSGPFTFTSLNHGTFETFCLERNETIALNVTYTAFSNVGAVAGGYGGAVDDGTGTGGTIDLVDPMTAYLYTDWKYHTSGTVYNITALQIAIWTIEDEFPNGIPANYNYPDGIKALANEYIDAAELAGWTNTHGVKALNLYKLNGQKAQDVLYVPEPMSLLLLGFGLLGLGITRRKLKK